MSDYNKYFRPSSEVINEAVKEIHNYRSGKEQPIKTRYNHFNQNSLGGIYKGNIIVIGGISGSGKTHILQQFEEDIFDDNLNPDNKDYFLIRNNWEMSGRKLLMRAIKNKTGYKYTDILFSENIDIEQLKRVANHERNPNILYFDTPVTADVWYNAMNYKLDELRKYKHIVITIDHIALVKDLKGNKKAEIDKLLMYMNELRKTYTNTSFIINTQLNRDIETRTDPRHLAPKRSDLYMSDSMFHIADIVLVIHNPYRLGIKKYMVVPVKKYEYLRDFMTTPDNKSSSFDAEGNIFWHYLKMRDIEDLSDTKDLYIERIFAPKKDVSNTEFTSVTGDNPFEDPFEPDGIAF